MRVRYGPKGPVIDISICGPAPGPLGHPSCEGRVQVPLGKGLGVEGPNPCPVRGQVVKGWGAPILQFESASSREGLGAAPLKS